LDFFAGLKQLYPIMNQFNSAKKCLLLLAIAGAFSSSAQAQMQRTIVRNVLAGTDDAEECIPGGSGTVGAMDLTSSDLEIMLDGTKNQLIGIRFGNIDIPQGATINRAYIQFANKGDKAPVMGDAYITGEAADNAATFTGTAFNISGRTQVADSVTWTGSTDASWGTTAGGAAGALQRTPDIKTIVQAIVNRAGWVSGNALVMMLKGTGVRNTYSYDGSASSAPKLIVEYTALSIPSLSAATLPINKNSDWKYLDNGTDQGTAWTANGFADAGWSYGPGKLGYNDNAVTTLSFGPNAADKYITYYFRKQFNIPNLSLVQDSLTISLLRDDGAIVYINGTEVVRDNMPAGAINYLTFAPTIIDGTAESTYYTFRVPKSVLVTGTNTIAVEIHQRDGTSSDLGFDLELAEYFPPPPPQNCNPLPATHISNFVSVLPSAQPDSLRIPSSHTFQMLVQSGDPYTNVADGNTKGTFDFTGYVPIGGSSTNGYLSINHEGGSWPAAGVSMLSLNYSTSTKLWSVTNNVPVDFGIIGGTGRNCSGTVTPWNTIITCEETLPTADVNADGFQDVGWAVEIDPATHAVMDHDYDNQADKLWRLGRMSHENVVVAPDMKTVYEGNDENPGYIFKLVADTAAKLGTGNLYVLKLQGAAGTATNGTWIQVPNSTPAECNNVRSFAASVSATNFNSVEDVEISPLDSMIYFTSKASSRVYRFRDNKTVGNATDVTNCEVFVGNANTMYNINYGSGTASEQWRDGNDNLTFDEFGNLYVIQDGGRNHIWMVKPCHTNADPKVELFAVTPAGCEPTGMTFSPDHKFMFVSMQHPNGSNTTAMTDAAGNPEIFNKESAIVIARREFLGNNVPLPVIFSSFNAWKTNENKAGLEWKYVSTERVNRFEIQRMVSGTGFETIGKVEKLSNAGEAITYAYTDEQPYAGKNFYRIKAMQADGKEVYTNVKVVDMPVTDKAAIVSAYPNPVVEQFHIAMVSPEAQEAVVKVYSTSGSVVLSHNTTLSAGNNRVTLNTRSLNAGIYQVTVQCGQQTLKVRMVKQ
jgi:secreted PhoX family phosphatase